MKLFLILILASFGLHAQEFASHHLEWVEGVKVASVVAETNKVPFKFFVTKDERAGYGPAFTFADKEDHGKNCVVVLNVGSRATTDTYLGRFASTKSSREIAIQTIWLHEFAHCIRLAERDYVSFGDRSDSTEEGFADVFALAWTFQNEPDKFSTAASYLTFLRRVGGDVRYSDKWIADKELITSSVGTPYEIANKIVFGK